MHLNGFQQFTNVINMFIEIWLLIWTPRNFTDEVDLIFRFLSLLLYLCCQIYLYQEELPEIYQDLQSFCCCEANLLLFHILIVKSKLAFWVLLQNYIQYCRKIMNRRFWNKKEKNIEKMLNKIGQKIKHWGTPDITVSNSLCLLFIWTHFLRSFK